MKVIVTLILLSFLLRAIPGYAATTSPGVIRAEKMLQNDSVPWTKEAFFRECAFDDSSRALIRYTFYQQRHFATQKAFMFILLGLGGFFILFAISNRRMTYGILDESDPGPGLLGGMMVAGATAIGITSFIQHGQYRKKLFYELKDYRKTGYIDPRIARSLIFRLCLKGEPREQLKLYKKEIRSHNWRSKAGQ